VIKKQAFFLLLSPLLLCLFGAQPASAALNCRDFFSEAASSGPLKIGDFSNDPVWVQFDQGYQNSSRTTINANRSTFLSADDRGHTYIELLKAAGLRLTTTELSVPSAKQVIAQYYKDMNQAIAAGIVTRDEILIPGRVFEDATGRKFGIPFGDPIPAGAAPARSAILTNPQYVSFIREGLFPMGGDDSAGGGFFHSMAEHDLEHIAAFRNNPRYGASVRRGISKLDPDHTVFTPVLNQRLLYFTEFLNFVPNSHRSTFRSSLPTDLLAPLDQRNLAHITSHLAQMPIAELTQLQRKLSSQFYAVIENDGGSCNDLSFSEHYHQSSAVSLLLWLKVQSDSSLATNNPSVIADKTARYILAADISGHVSPDDWIDDLVSEHMDRNSKLYKYLCESGVWENSTDVFRSFCL
jgi:hypothetical protein